MEPLKFEAGKQYDQICILQEAFQLHIDMELKGNESEKFRKFLKSSGLQDKGSGNGAGEKWLNSKTVKQNCRTWQLDACLWERE